jgi:hypothetical protein
VSKSFTPRPWEVAHAGCGLRDGTFEITEYFVRRPGDNVSIAADIIDPATGEPSEEYALLIAAAPMLLEALQDCREALRRAGADGELAVVDAAIAAATGEKP